MVWDNNNNSNNNNNNNNNDDDDNSRLYIRTFSINVQKCFTVCVVKYCMHIYFLFNAWYDIVSNIQFSNKCKIYVS